jgi:hypothetical protein
LDTTQGREKALNGRQSFVNLVSSASLLLSSKIEVVVITQDNFMVKWNQLNLDKRISPTKVTNII